MGHSRDRRNSSGKEERPRFQTVLLVSWHTAAFWLPGMLPKVLSPWSSIWFPDSSLSFVKTGSLPAGSQVPLILLKPNWSQGSEKFELLLRVSPREGNSGLIPTACQLHWPESYVQRAVIWANPITNCSTSVSPPIKLTSGTWES